ncbi:hypothetical protein HDU79_001151 [Rhizoclosmatium sp. JEL0117]|nr:hypothetical protein HDU79_001151 [Rhizoclosmatium sp. JEL0117]
MEQKPLISKVEAQAFSPTSPTKKSSWFERAWDFVSSSIVGLVFGFALEKAKVYLPSVIVRQMQWTELTMLVVFLTATLAGMLTIATLEYLKQFKRCPKPPLGLFEGATLLGKYGNNIIGGALVGVGMSLAGACPGTVLVQLGAGVPTAPYVFVGALGGAVSFGYIHKATKAAVKSFGAKKPVEVVDGKHASYLTIAIIAGLVGFPVMWFLNSNIPWRSDMWQDAIKDFNISKMTKIANPFLAVGNLDFSVTLPAWSPFTAGLGIGLAQFLSILLTDSVIGASSVYPYIGSVIISTFDQKWETNVPFYKDYASLWTSSVFAVGMTVGSFLSVTGSGLCYGSGIASTTGTSVISAALATRLVLGGVSLVYGSRIAGGCTSGHGISGMSQLSIASVITVAAMFGGGTAVALLVGEL